METLLLLQVGGYAPKVAIVPSLKLSYTLPNLTLMLYPCTHADTDTFVMLVFAGNVGSVQRKKAGARPAFSFSFIS